MSKLLIGTCSRKYNSWKRIIYSGEANVDFYPFMTAEDLKKAGPDIEDAIKRCGS
jgi:hypothetical protein